MSFKAGRDIAGKYIVEKEIGEGGIAVVYKVSHNRLKIPRALKVLKISHPKLRERLEKEAELQAKMSHPNVVSVLDVVEVDGCIGLILEYIDGMALDEWLLKYRPSLDEAQSIFLEILDALEEAHILGIIHRDLKPSNILMQNTRKGWTAKVCDFGLAKALEENDSRMTKTGVTMGTPAYMAPEQIRDSKNVDQQADIFSLGAIFYELVTGTKAFKGSDTLELLNAVANVPHLPPQNFLKNIPHRFEEAINGSLEKKTAKRISDCHTLREILLGNQFWSSPPDHETNNETMPGIDLLLENSTISPENLNISPVELNRHTPTSEQRLPTLSPLEDSSDSVQKQKPTFQTDLNFFDAPYSDVAKETFIFDENAEQESSSKWPILLLVALILTFGYLNQEQILAGFQAAEHSEILEEPAVIAETNDLREKSTKPKVKATNTKPKARNAPMLTETKATKANIAKPSSKEKPVVVTEPKAIETVKTIETIPPEEVENKLENAIDKPTLVPKNTVVSEDTEPVENPIEELIDNPIEEPTETITEKKELLSRSILLGLPPVKELEVKNPRIINNDEERTVERIIPEEKIVEDDGFGSILFTNIAVDNYVLEAPSGEKFKGPDIPVGAYKLLLICEEQTTLIRYLDIKKGSLLHLACSCKPTATCIGT